MGGRGALDGDRPLAGGVSKLLPNRSMVPHLLDGAEWRVLYLGFSLSLTRDKSWWWWDHALHLHARDAPKRLGSPCCCGPVKAMELEAIPALQTLRLHASQILLPCVG